MNLYVVSPRLGPDDGRPGNVTSPCSLPIKAGAAITADDKEKGGISVDVTTRVYAFSDDPERVVHTSFNSKKFSIEHDLLYNCIISSPNVSIIS